MCVHKLCNLAYIITNIIYPTLQQYTPTYTHTLTHSNTHSKHIHKHTQTHTYTHTYIHTYTHARTQTRINIHHALTYAFMCIRYVYRKSASINISTVNSMNVIT